LTYRLRKNKKLELHTEPD